MDEAVRQQAPDRHATIPDSLWRARWVVHCQSAGSGNSVVRYLARCYVKRTAISDERIVRADDDTVSLRYTDSATRQSKVCTLSSEDGAR